MTLVIESMEGTTNGSAVTNGQLASGIGTLKGGTATVNGDSTWALPGAGSKSARVVCASGVTDFGYFIKQSLNVTQISLAMGLRWNSLPSPNSISISSKILTVRNSTSNMAFLRYGGTTTSLGNVYQILDSSATVKHTSPAFDALKNYYFQFVAVMGAGTGRIISNIYEDGLLWDSYDSGTTLNTGSTNFVDVRWAKMDNSAAGMDANVDYVAYDDGSATVIPLPATASAVANAGADSTIDSFAGWVPGDGNIARTTVDGSQSSYTGGTPTFAWTGPAGVTFATPSSATTDVTFPNDLTDQNYTVTLTVTVGSVSSSDSLTLTVKGAERAYAAGGAWKPARKIYL